MINVYSSSVLRSLFVKSFGRATVNESAVVAVPWGKRFSIWSAMLVTMLCMLPASPWVSMINGVIENSPRLFGTKGKRALGLDHCWHHCDGMSLWLSWVKGQPERNIYTLYKQGLLRWLVPWHVNRRKRKKLPCVTWYTEQNVSQYQVWYIYIYICEKMKDIFMSILSLGCFLHVLPTSLWESCRMKLAIFCFGKSGISLFPSITETLVNPGHLWDHLLWCSRLCVSQRQHV